jgi:hypothetical protein
MDFSTAIEERLHGNRQVTISTQENGFQYKSAKFHARQEVINHMGQMK